jgi:lysophospholipase L1-like esterase
MHGDARAVTFALPNVDHTHFSEKGARLLACLVAKEAGRLFPAVFGKV